MTDDELTAALTNATAGQFAELLVLVIGIAAHKHPDRLRHALSLVFSLKATEEYALEAERHARDARSEVAKETAEMRAPLGSAPGPQLRF